MKSPWQTFQQKGNLYDFPTRILITFVKTRAAYKLQELPAKWFMIIKSINLIVAHVLQRQTPDEKKCFPQKDSSKLGRSFHLFTISVIICVLEFSTHPAAKFWFPCFSRFQLFSSDQSKNSLWSEKHPYYNSLSKVLGDTLG